VSILAAWFVLYAVVLSPIEASHRQALLYNDLREDLALQTAPLGGQIIPGTPLALLDSEDAGINDVVVVEGTASGDLMNGPGHKRDTVLPGQIGVSVLYGRASLFGGPFGSVAGLRTGDKIVATTGQGVFTYVVQGVRRAGDSFPAPLAAGAGRLTLVSAEGNGRFGFLAPQAVVYIDAALQGQAQPTLPGRPSVVPKSEQAMQGDPSALLPLALALPLLVGAVLLVAWARTRWGGWQTWVIGAPILLATVWAVSQAAVQLLPNLL
jgi:sortase A